MTYVAPSFTERVFTCPHCKALSHMSRYTLDLPGGAIGLATRCNCGEHTIWVPLAPGNWSDGVMIYPISSTAPAAEPDMPQFIKADFEEARLVFNHSPRAAAALLRLCVEKLCQHLLKKPGKIHNQIGELVDLGFPKRTLQAFDTIRIFGNESVHPGTLDLNDTPEVAIALFRLLNLAVRHCITEENELQEIRALTPKEKRRDI